jgi:hypothetical protein
MNIHSAVDLQKPLAHARIICEIRNSSRREATQNAAERHNNQHNSSTKVQMQQLIGNTIMTHMDANLDHSIVSSSDRVANIAVKWLEPRTRLPLLIVLLA